MKTERTPLKSSQLSVGTVYLVGAGPGDPELLTVKAMRLLKSAKVLAHDLLVPEAILSQCPATVERLAVGRRRGGGPTPWSIHPSIIERARLGQDVVRLKAGDPMVFGRGAEEAMALREAGIPYEIVPGISAALGAASYTGIPLTHRELSSDVTLTTGHDAGGELISHSNWQYLTAGKGTLVMYMVGHRLKENLARCIKGGRGQHTPAAFIRSATRPEQEVYLGTLQDLAAKIGPNPHRKPGILIVGEVAALHSQLAWFQQRPLEGQRLLVARARAGTSVLSQGLRGLGAEVIETPEVEVQDLLSNLHGSSQVAIVGRCDRLILSCSKGAKIWCNSLPTKVAISHKYSVVTVGEQARKTLLKNGVSPDYHFGGACAQALSDAPELFADANCALLMSERGRPALTAILQNMGARIHPIICYKHSYRYPKSLGPIDAIVLPSSTSARLLKQAPLPEQSTALPTLVIGPLTEEAANAVGFHNIISAQEDTVSSLLNACVETLNSR